MDEKISLVVPWVGQDDLNTKVHATEGGGDEHTHVISYDAFTPSADESKT